MRPAGVLFAAFLVAFSGLGQTTDMRGTGGARRRALRRRCIIAAAAALLSRRPAPSQGCQTPRSFTDEESSFLTAQTRALKDLVPAAPTGWTRYTMTTAASQTPLCDDPGYKPPLFVRVMVGYLPADAPELTAEKRQAEYDAWQEKLNAATRAWDEAARSGDRVRTERAKSSLRNLRTLSPLPPNLRASRRRMDVWLSINATSFQPCGRGVSVEVDGAGAAFALRAASTTCHSKIAGGVFSVAFGAWKTAPTTAGARLAAFNQWPGPPVVRAQVHTVLAEIFGETEAVDAAARGLELEKPKSLLAR